MAGDVMTQIGGLVAPIQSPDTMEPPAVRPGSANLVLQTEGLIPDADLRTEDELALLVGSQGQEPLPPDQDERWAAHDANLVEALSPSDLGKLGDKLAEQIDRDISSNKDWEQRFARGLEIVGLKDWQWSESHQAPFEGASTAVNPVLADGIIQSQARLMEEVFPAKGPAKTMVMGEEDDEKRASADRVEAHMNYQLTIEDPTYMKESEKMGIYLPMFGCAYRKGYHDYVMDQNVLRFVPGTDLILPYNARSLETAQRRTHRYELAENEYKQGVKAGAYADITLPEPPVTPLAGNDRVREETDKVDGKTPEPHPDDKNFTFYECDTYLDLPGFEDKTIDPVTGATKKTGVALPFTVTLEKESHKVVAIRRCWDENDNLKRMLERYAEYWYLPGIGSKGMGLIHWIGALADAGTDALRALLDSATWANMQGGFKAKDANVKAGELHMAPGVWKDVDMTAEELSKAFHTPPFKEPSEALFKLLGFLTDLARRFCGTTDIMVGDQQAKGAPVGTTIELIEQGSKVYSGTHRRAHTANGAELRMLYRLNAQFIPLQGYPYKIPGKDMSVFQKDYNTDIVCVVPVSDPNIFSQTQRIALAQTEYQLMRDNPADFKRKEVLSRLLKALKEPDPDGVLIDHDNIPIMDPVSENIAMTTARPVKAKDGENHDAHLIVHMSFMQHPQFGGLPQAKELIGPAMMAHIAEHVALKYAEVQRQMGVPVPPINLGAQPGESVAGAEQPQQAMAIAMAAAGMTGQFFQMSGLTTTPPGQDGANQEVVDKHHESQAKQWSYITAGLASLAKAGQTLQQGQAAEAAILNGDGTAAPPGSPVAPSGQQGAPQPQPQPAAAPAA